MLMTLVSFDTLALGTSPLTFSQVVVADAFGGKLIPSVGGGSVNVIVSEPNALLLLGAAIAGMMLIGRKRVFRK